MVADLVRYGARNETDQKWVQDELRAVLEEADARGGLGRKEWAIQPQGDGELALLPPGIDEARVIPTLIRELGSGLHARNRRLSEDARLRVRIAFHQGIIEDAGCGYAGDAVVTVSRFCDAPAVKAALRAAPEAFLAVVMSPGIYQDVVLRRDLYELRANDFRRITEPFSPS
ncbi:hypothetical protein AB0F17_63000 [Nonomuraea sp. NPDC026600]|uniref:hypothetical protein n=1 Tax=Nonomuraea sp. NPDC026600 TaxID=3155363 RepID=UPI0033D65D6E